MFLRHWKTFLGSGECRDVLLILQTESNLPLMELKAFPEIWCLPQDINLDPHETPLPEKFQVPEVFIFRPFFNLAFFWSMSLFEWRENWPNWTAIQWKAIHLIGRSNHPKIPAGFPANLSSIPKDWHVGEQWRNRRGDLWGISDERTIRQNSKRFFRKGAVEA